ncbi:zinc-ribbon domain-containing protein [Pediococcus acidilactici]
MKFCLNCGEKLPEKAHFCPNCGAKVEAAPSDGSRLSRAELHKRRREESVDDPVETADEKKEEPPIASRSRRKDGALADIQQGALTTLQWLGGNWLAALLGLAVIGAIFYWLSKLVGVVLLAVAIGAAFFYAQRVGANDHSADQAVKTAWQRMLTASQNIWHKLQAKASKKRGQRSATAPTTEKESVEKVADSPQEELIEDEVSSTADERHPTSVDARKKRRWTLRNQVIMGIALIVGMATYWAPFASAPTAGYNVKVTLMSILKTLGDDKLVQFLWVTPVLLLLGALLQFRWLTKWASYLNFLWYAMMFFLIYQNEAQLVGLANMFSGVRWAWGGYLIVALSIVLLIMHSTSRRRKWLYNICCW